MRYEALSAVLIALLVLACDSKKSRTEPPPSSAAATNPRAQLTDLTTASTLAPVRAAFNAKKGEVRFLTLLSPT